MERPATTEFRILGPLEVVAQGESISLASGRQNALLSLLLLTPNEVCSKDRLISELWEGQPPETAANILHVYVSQLRKALPPETIVTRAPGYAVEVQRGQLDLDRFEKLVEEATPLLSDRPEAAAARLRKALALWRGPPLAEFAYEEWARNAIARLDELRLVAVERRIEADLALGEHGELVGELETLVRDQPLRERLRAQLMLALYRTGRQADALAVYQDGRQKLVDELGIDPGQSLQQLEQAILRHDPALEPRERDCPPDPDANSEPLVVAPPPPELPETDRSILVVPWSDDHLESLLALAEPLARDPAREVILVNLVSAGGDIAAATAHARQQKETLEGRGIPTRSAAFSSDEPGADTIRLASKQDVDLVIVDAPASLVETGAFDDDASALLESAPCDVAFVAQRSALAGPPGSNGPVLVPFGGADHEWAAVELAAWIASSQGAGLQLLGTEAEADSGRRDASRLLASA
ncbi:MAG: AfsR/SARP family transcriptional regulator, partial [Gaiellaceae bacterium]